jgi:hypothetical protein
MHKFFTRLATVAMLTIALSGTEIRADRTKLDPSTGLIVTGDWELVRDNCTACHAAKLITQRRGSAAEWLRMVRWKQAQQDLRQFDPDTEEKIIANLAENYPPQADRRRAPIPSDLMPPKPDAAQTTTEQPNN